ncbi:MAG: site-specific DNA-methyltransferase, partial [Nitrospirae bacterium]|nr:site-specific DNA-methyltransferase [Nitrospirota bacterium]
MTEDEKKKLEKAINKMICADCVDKMKRLPRNSIDLGITSLPKEVNKKKLKEFKNKIICGDCVDKMKLLPRNSVDLVVTSPPYGFLRDYIGFKFRFEKIARELFRVIKPGGVLVWVVGDFVLGTGLGKSCTPERQLLFFNDRAGFTVHDKMIFKKNSPSSPIREEYNTRYQQVFENMYILSKGPLKTFNPIKDRKVKYNGSLAKGSHRMKNGELRQYTKKNKPPKEYDLRYNVWTGCDCAECKYAEESNNGNVFTYLTGGWGMSSSDKIAKDHPAIGPEMLAYDLIYTYTNENEIVLDPMCGSGTTLKMAKILNRKYIGIDVS